MGRDNCVCISTDFPLKSLMSTFLDPFSKKVEMYLLSNKKNVPRLVVSTFQNFFAKPSRELAPRDIDKRPRLVESQNTNTLPPRFPSVPTGFHDASDLLDIIINNHLLFVLLVFQLINFFKRIQAILVTNTGINITVKCS